MILKKRMRGRIASFMHLGGSEDLQKLAPSDEYEEELALMAEVRAYFKVAYKACCSHLAL